MYYIGPRHDNPVAPRFEKYEVEYILSIKDRQSTLLVVPETITELLENFREIRPAIWWLSVDNYLVTRTTFRSKLKIRYWRKYLTGRLVTRPEIDFNDKRIIHLAQSQYAMDFLKHKKVDSIYYLSDYLNGVFLNQQVDYTSRYRKDIVLYNPLKGLAATARIMARFPQFNYVPLANMTPEQVCGLCRSAKVYIDFGHHPGKDRFPREAAILGCCVITNRRGAAGFHQDVGIMDEYKFNDDKTGLAAIGQKISEILSNYDEKVADFHSYRKTIRHEEAVFEKSLRQIFWRETP